MVSIETWYHALDQIQPGVSMEKIVELRKANPGGGPHSLTGPVFVNRAEPGDVLEVRIQRIVPKKEGFNFNLPGKEFPTVGALQEDFPEGFVKFFKIDWKRKTAEFKPGITIDIKPFPGILAVGVDPNDPAPDRFKKEGKISILLVEQYLDFCLAVGDSFYIMDRGSIVAEGPIAHLNDDMVKLHLTV